MGGAPCEGARTQQLSDGYAHDDGSDSEEGCRCVEDTRRELKAGAVSEDKFRVIGGIDEHLHTVADLEILFSGTRVALMGIHLSVNGILIHGEVHRRCVVVVHFEGIHVMSSEVDNGRLSGKGIIAAFAAARKYHKRRDKEKHEVDEHEHEYHDLAYQIGSGLIEH